MWNDFTLADRIDALAREKPNAPAFITPFERFTWQDYAETSDRIAACLHALGLARGDRVGVLMPDIPLVHAAFVGVEKAGLVTVGIGSRAGEREIAHILSRTAARALITLERFRAALPEIEHIVLLDTLPPRRAPIRTRLSPDELFMINSTSGTTGMPKCVMHSQNRWVYFHEVAAEAGGFRSDEIFLGAVPAPFGFGLWTAHFSPAILGAPSIIMERFDADLALDLIERERVTVLCCVSTQFIMLLNAQARRPRDLSSLRCMFTGGEAVPYERAAEFEAVTGAAVLQFYGSNETGALSRTTKADGRERRLRSAGRIIPEMNVRLFDPETGAEVARRGQPGCRGPALCLGYWDDLAANARLYTRDGWMLMGDIVEIDDDGYLRVVGRISDFIIRGGKNLSAPAIEEEVATHPDVALVAAVPVPDPVFGERVGIYVVPRTGRTPTLDEINGHLRARGVSREWLPEYLVLMEDLPRSSGAKIAKSVLREDANARWG